MRGGYSEERMKTEPAGRFMIEGSEDECGSKRGGVMHLFFYNSEGLLVAARRDRKIRECL